MDNTELGGLLAHELRLAERYRFYVSLVMLSIEQTTETVEARIRGSIRACDRFFSINHQKALLLSHTTTPEAQQVVDRIKSALGRTARVRHSIATYPGDVAPAKVLEEAARRLNVATVKETASTSGTNVDHG